MLALRLQSLSFSYSDRAPLFRDVNLHLSPGWTGLVGTNGSGKTTFLRLVQGELEPQAGQLCREPSTLEVAYCPQRVESLTAEISSFAAASDRAAQRLSGILRLDSRDLERWSELSPGERKRWQTAAALHAEPQMLLLDEPTNHLDAVARNLLIEALIGFRGIGILVSHDRQLLDRLTASTLRLDGGELRLWPGAYSSARSVWTAAEAERRKLYEQRRTEERKIERRLADTRRQQRASEARISPRKRMKGRRDHDARSMAAKNRVRLAEQKLGRRVAVLRHQLAKRRAESAAMSTSKAKGRSLFVDYEPAPRSRLVTLEREELKAGDRLLLHDLRLTVERGTRCWLTGANGSGKTTLLEALRRAASVPPERLLHLPQELTAAAGRALLSDLLALPAEERGRVLQMVAALGSNPERLLASATPSPGEARKLKIAFGLARRVWALLLDEPTNHLDLPSIERLETMLKSYPWALLLVTHDDRLAAAVSDETWLLTKGRLDIS